MKLINKDTLLAEIEDWCDKIKKGIFSIPLTGSDRSYATFEYEILGKVRDFIDHLEVKEVDEVKIGETQIYLEDDGGEPPYEGKQWLDLSCMEYEIPKDLFKDGDNVEIFIRKAQKGE